MGDATGPPSGVKAETEWKRSTEGLNEFDDDDDEEEEEDSVDEGCHDGDEPDAGRAPSAAHGAGDTSASSAVARNASSVTGSAKAAPSAGWWSGALRRPPAAGARPGRLRAFAVRSVFTLIMLLCFSWIVYLGHQKVAILVFVLQALISKELMSIGYVQAHKRRIPLFRSLNSWFLFCGIYFVYGKRSLSHLYDRGHGFMRRRLPTFLLMHHTFLSFWFFLAGFMAFVLSLRPGLYKYQLNQFARMLMLLLVVVAQANFMIYNIKEGMIWFLLPALLIVVNDVMSYLVGTSLGRTRLTPLSPKKTWEGYIGGAMFTLVAGVFLSEWMARHESLVCRKPDFSDCALLARDPPLHCTPVAAFVPQEYALPEWLAALSGRATMRLRPIQVHGVVLAAFASIVGPFGGFFASGVKRAFHLKDFAGIIPGHGGITDRMDCQLLMGFFTFVYRLNVVNASAPDVENLLMYIADLSFREQIELHRALTHMLTSRGFVEPSDHPMQVATAAAAGGDMLGERHP